MSGPEQLVISQGVDAYRRICSICKRSLRHVRGICDRPMVLNGHYNGSHFTASGVNVSVIMCAHSLSPSLCVSLPVFLSLCLSPFHLLGGWLPPSSPNVFFSVEERWQFHCVRLLAQMAPDLFTHTWFPYACYQRCYSSYGVQDAAFRCQLTSWRFEMWPPVLLGVGMWVWRASPALYNSYGRVIVSTAI